VLSVNIIPERQRNHGYFLALIPFLFVDVSDGCSVTGKIRAFLRDLTLRVRFLTAVLRMWKFL